MKSGVAVDLKGRTLTLRGSEPEPFNVDVAPGVFVKLDGKVSCLEDLRPGDRCECHENQDGTLAVLKVRREVPDGCEASTSPSSTDGTDSFKRE